MITKILFTALIIAAALMYLRHRGAPAQRPRAGTGGPPSTLWRILPALLLAAGLGVGAWMFWLDWQKDHELYTVRVIDTRSGQVRIYAVFRDGVQGRSFETVDGRRVTLADVERMEVLKGAPTR